MALEIFEVFRRRQKVILAWLAVLAMFLFIIGDVLIGVRMGHYGLGYGLRRLFLDTTLEELELMHEQRQAAHSFLVRARFRAEEILRRTKFSSGDPEKDETLRKEYQRELRTANDTLCGDIFLRAYQWAPLAQLGLPLDVVAYEFPLTAEGLLEFAYWKEQANRLGIVIGPELLRQDFEKFTFGLLPEQEWYRLVQDSRIAAAPSIVLGWVADEVRASLAKRIVEGPGHSRAVELTPLDLWQAYRDLRTVLPQVGIASLSIDEERFIKAVPEPDESQLRAYFDEHKLQEPDPMRPSPGFRVPTRYRVEFVYADFRYDPKDPAGIGEAWPLYRQMVESLLSLGGAFRWTPAVYPAGAFAPVVVLPPTELPLRAYDLYRANQWQRYRIDENLASFALTNTPPDQRVHHHEILPPGTGPWYMPGASECEQAAQLVSRGLNALTAMPGIAAPVGLLAWPVSIRAPRTEAQMLDLAATLGRTVASTLALAAPTIASREPAMLTSAPVEMVMAASLVGQMAGPVIPLTVVEAWQVALRSPIHLETASVVPGYAGLAVTLWAPPVAVPFASVASELEVEYLRGEVSRFVHGDLETLRNALAEYRQEYQKAYTAWRKAARSKSPFVPPPLSKTKQPIEQYVQSFCQPRGLRYFAMKELRSQYELMPRHSGELAKILYPLYLESRNFPPATRPAEIWNRELEFARKLISGEEFLIQPGPKPKPEETKESGSYSVYEPRFLIPRENAAHLAMIWKAEENPGYVPTFDEARDRVVQAWRREKARELARQHAEQLAERIRQRRQDEHRPIEDVLTELKGQPEFVELTRLETVELRRYEWLPLGSPITGLEPVAPGPLLRPVSSPPVVDYPDSNFLDQAYQQLRQPGDVWITTNQPADKVYVLVLLQPRREPTPQEFEADYLKRPYAERIKVGMPTFGSQTLEEWVRSQKVRELRRQFHQFLRQRYNLDDEKYRQLEDLVRRSR